MQSGIVKFLDSDMSSEAQFKTSKSSQILYKYSVKSVISIKVEWTWRLMLHFYISRLEHEQILTIFIMCFKLAGYML